MTIPSNVKVSQRMQVIDISSVEISGVLSENHHDEDTGMYGWRMTDGRNVASLTEWLDAFEGKNVIVSIKLAHYNDDGVSLRKKPMEPNNENHTTD